MPNELISVSGAGDIKGYEQALLRRYHEGYPWFYKEASTIMSPHESFFGIYAFRSILRGILASGNFLLSGDLLLNQHFYAPSLILYYTGAFHVLQSYLSLQGFCLIESVKGPLEIIRKDGNVSIGHLSFEGNKEMIMAKLTKENCWIFEDRRRGHSSRWGEIAQIFQRTEEVPRFFINFFKDLLSYGRYEPDHEVDELIEEGLKVLAELRHQAVYQGFAIDDFTYDGLVNREIECGPINAKAQAYKEFGYSLLEHCLNCTITLKASIDEEDWKRCRGLLKSTVMQPPFEIGFKPFTDRVLNEKYETVLWWLLE